MAGENPIILIADDTKINRTLVKRCLKGYGYQFLEAENGQEALEKIRTHDVDLVILDLIMPVLDGFAFLEKLYAEPLHTSIPVIVNSSLEDMTSIQRALALGSYDYFIKALPKEHLQVILPLKVRNAIQAKRLLDDVCEKKAILEREIQAAGRYQRFLLPKEFKAKGMEVEAFFHPYIGVGGDFFDFIPLTEDKTAFIIADVTGHGVLSAMVAAILKPLFRQYVQDTESPLHTVQRLNQDFLTLTDDTHYVTAFVGVYDPHQHTLCYANAGHPPPLYLHHTTDAIEILKATGVFLGLFEDAEWSAEEKVLTVASGDCFLLITDGVSEAQSATGAFFGTDSLPNVLRDMAGEALTQTSAHLWQHLQAFSGGQLTDDVTFVIIRFRDIGTPRVVRVPNEPAQVLPVVEAILRTLGHRGSCQDREAIKISLVEIILNAIEHGNLAIGYAHKHAALEAGTFDALVAERQCTTPYASRQVTIEYVTDAIRASFTVSDEGAGFDWRVIPDPRAADKRMMAHGRGVLIARANMDECTFHQPGNRVTLVKRFSQPVAAAHTPEHGG
jgi:serine phosphatase RsbU (regulator of sigma subunit)/anti-sigma regulatory factor (Ser/Thr protein kinase)